MNSFAAYFPSSSKVKEAKSKGDQYTNQKGEFFVSDVEDKDNIEKSKVKMIASCNEYFRSEYTSITACQEKLHEELLFIEKSKAALLSLAQEASQFNEISGFGHKLGGYPAFTQEDPRDDANCYSDHQILLLQIDSIGTKAHEIMWGDSGICNFFITEKTFKERDFSKVIYNWDCY